MTYLTQPLISPAFILLQINELQLLSTRNIEIDLCAGRLFAYVGSAVGKRISV